MPDEDTRPSLEPPRLFGRRRKDVPADSEPEVRDAPAAAVPEPGVPDPVPDPLPGPEPVPTPEPTPVPDPVPEPEPLPDPMPEPAPAPPDPDPTPQPTRPPFVDDLGAVAERPRLADRLDESVEAARSATAQDPPVARTLATGAPLFTDEAPPDDRRPARAKSRRVPRGPVITGYPASALTGLLVGALMVGLTAAALRGCEAVRGTSTCGGPGLLILVIILVALILVGQVLLRLLRVPDPGSTSFLAVGLIAVVALLFLVDVILSWWMIIVIPLVGMATFLLSHWVTTAWVELPDDR